MYAPWARGQLPQKTWVVQLVQLQRQFDCWILQGISEGNLCRATLVGGEGGQAAAHGLHHSQPKRLIQRRLHKRPVLVCTAQRTLSCAPHSAAAHTPWDGPCSAPQHTPFGRGFLWGTVLLCQMPVKLTLQQCALLASCQLSVFRGTHRSTGREVWFKSKALSEHLLDAGSPGKGHRVSDTGLQNSPTCNEAVDLAIAHGILLGDQPPEFPVEVVLLDDVVHLGALILLLLVCTGRPV